MHCSYCKQYLATIHDNVAEETDGDHLKCVECECVVHAKCLRTCRPGDLLGDIFFDFTCADCMNLQMNNMPSTSASAQMASLTPRENFVRQHLSWFMIVVLTLYNLAVKSKGLSHNGFFHWRSHIVNFINKNWDYLMESGTRRRKNWFGSISGNLSHYSPDFFLSGQETIQKPGWWRLAEPNLTPKMIQRKFEEYSRKRAKMRNSKRSNEDFNNTEKLHESSQRSCLTDSDNEMTPCIDGCSRTIPFSGRTVKSAKYLDMMNDDMKNLEQQPEQETPLNTVQSSLMDFLAENLDNYDLLGSLPNNSAEYFVGGDDEKIDLLPLLDMQSKANESIFSALEMKSNFNRNKNATLNTLERVSGKQQRERMPSIDVALNQEDSMQTLSEYSNDAEEDDEYQPRIVKVTNFQQLKQSSKKNPNSAADEQQLVLSQLSQEFKKEPTSDSELSSEEEAIDEEEEKDAKNDERSVDESRNTLSTCKPSLFTKTPRHTLPWLVKNADEDEELLEGEMETEKKTPNGNLRMMTEYEEIELLQKMRQIFDVEEESKIQIPAYVRRFYRKLCVRQWKREHGKPLFDLDEQVNGKRRNDKTQIIDRYQLITDSTSKKYKTFYARIAGSFDYEMFESPYSHRILHPFIFRDEEIAPPWLKLMCELQFRVNKTYPTRSAIDFCYVRPNHIAAVNALLQTTFWPDIDMSECLSYPDYSVVALYKKLVVGCGFLVPDVGPNEAYTSFMAVRPNWQRCGIGTFMLYHLIQTCMTRDITLHVSASNPAIVLYQKFGFKIEEVIHDFYDKYLPIDSKESRTAFFLRLLR